MEMPKVRQLPSESRRRGLPAVGLDLVIAEGVVAEPAPAGQVAVLAERRRDGRTIGVMAIELVPARLIIDRDGTLAQLAVREAPASAAYAVAFEAGATGFRADVVRTDRPELPYQSWLALAPADLAAAGAVIVTVEAVADEWDAATAMLSSLRVFSRDADARAASEDAGEALPLPLPVIK